MNNFEQAIINAANKKYGSLEEELEAYNRHDKFKAMCESHKKFNKIIWYFVLTSIPGKDSDTNQVINEVIKNAVETWGSEAKEVMKQMGVSAKKDIVDMLIIASEHGIISGSPDEYISGDLFT